MSERHLTLVFPRPNGECGAALDIDRFWSMGDSFGMDEDDDDDDDDGLLAYYNTLIHDKSI